MKNTFILSLLSIFLATPLMAENIGVPAECEDVMLQAFYWNSHSKPTAKYGRTQWADLIADTTEIRESFDLVWFPPATMGGGVGYYPKCYSLFTGSGWGQGSATLKKLILALRRGGCRALADIVINHRASNNGWARGFMEDDFGSYGRFQLTSEHVCAGDEAFSDQQSDSRDLPHGAADTGTNDAGCRDLDHTNPYVQDLCKAYTKFMLDSIGFSGFRYDMTRGYHGRYVSMYNAYSQPYFSVGECWESIDVIADYLEAAEYNTLSFDFPLKYAINNIPSGSYQSLAKSGMRTRGLSRYAVTFIDNHDTFERDGGEYCGNNVDITTKRSAIVRANAFILMMPGVPCVFYPHWVTFKQEIQRLIQIRKIAGIHSESLVTDETAGNGFYSATIHGHRGNVILRMGADRDKEVPAGYELVFTGAEFGKSVLADVYVSEGLMQAVESVSEPASTSSKQLRNGQLVIVRDAATYDVLGRPMEKR